MCVGVFLLAVDVDDRVVERGGAGVRQTVLPLTLSVHGMVGAQGAGLGLLQAHQLHRSTLATYGKCGVLLCTHQTCRSRRCVFHLNDGSSHSLNLLFCTFFGFYQCRITAEDLLCVIQNKFDHGLLNPHCLEGHVSVIRRHLDVLTSEENVDGENNCKCRRASGKAAVEIHLPQQVWSPDQRQVPRVHVCLGAQCGEVGQVPGEVLQSPEHSPEKWLSLGFM